MKRLLVTCALALAVILPGFSLMGTPSAAADSCWLLQANIYAQGSRVYGFGQTQCSTNLSRTLRVFIIQDGVSRASGTTTGNATILSSSPSCAIQYAGPYPSYVRVQLTSSSGFVWNWYTATTYLPRC